MNSPSSPCLERPATAISAAVARRRGFTLIETLVTLTVIGILMTIGFGAFRNYTLGQQSRRATQALAWEVTLARSYAIRSGRRMIFVADESALKIEVRDTTGTIWRELDMGPTGELSVGILDLTLPGDSLVFSRRGICLNCLTGQTATIRVGDGFAKYTLEISLLGRVEVLPGDW